MKRTIGIAVVAVVAGLAMTAGAVELNAVKAGDISGMTVADTVAVPEAARNVPSKIVVTPTTSNWQDTLLVKFVKNTGMDMVMHVLDSVDLSPVEFFDSGDGYLVRVDIKDALAPLRAAKATGFSVVETVQVNRTVYAMLEGGSLKSAAVGTSGQALMKELSEVLASGPLPGGCALEVNAFRASAFQPGTGDNLNVGIMKGGEYTDILMVGVAQAAASSDGRKYAYESVSCPSDNWVGRCEKDSFTLATDAGGRITSVSIERAKEKSGLLRGGWKVTSSVVCR
ncbi:MAG: hypothetical protein A2X31_03870 [Elusimicrobia bacterium GWB2_63_22]|nr:MAG: hypothetical protein A2X31_03870 [Elusimicrobia bacterium GWB2_63_22]